MKFRFYLFVSGFLFIQSVCGIDYVVTLGTDSAVSGGGCGSGTTGDLRYVLNQILNSQVEGVPPETHTIRFNVPEITLTNIMPAISLFSSDTITIGNSSGSLTLSDSNAIRGAHNLTFMGAGDTTVSGVVEIGRHTLTQSGSGKVTLSGTNTYSGGTEVSSGILNVQNSLALGDGPTLVASGAQLQLEGDIVAPNPLLLNGAGEGSGALVNVSGKNIYEGAITLGAPAVIGSNCDTLTLSNSHAIGGSHNVTFVGAGNTVVSGAIATSTGAVIKNGPGMLSLLGANTYSGGTIVSEGRLSVNGQVLGGVTVNPGGTLEGTGTIYGGGTIFGMLYPGNSIGTITFDTSDGNLILDSSSITSIEIDPWDSSKIVITGGGHIALNDSTLNIVQNPGAYLMDREYLILDGPYTGEFNPIVTGGLSGCKFELFYDPNIIRLLLLTTPYELPTSQLSGNNLAVANYLNQNGAAPICSFFANLSESQEQEALSQVSPSRNAFGIYAMQQTACSLSGLVTEHIDVFRAEGMGSAKDAFMANLTADASGTIRQPADSSKPKAKFSAWISGFGQYAHQSQEDQNPAFHYLSGAALVGFDYRGGARSLVGVAGGYANTQLSEDDNFGHVGINYYFVSLYGNFFIHNFYFSPSVWGFFDENHNTRQIVFSGFSGTATANSHVWQLLPHLEIGYDGQFSWGDIIPFSSLDWAISWQDGYQESGAAPFNVVSGAKTSSMLWSETGLKFSEKWESSWGAFFLLEKLSYAFQTTFGTGSVNSTFVGTPGAFTVVAVTENLNLAVVELNFIAAIGKEKPWNLGLAYEGAFGSNYWASELILTINKSF